MERSALHPLAAAPGRAVAVDLAASPDRPLAVPRWLAVRLAALAVASAAVLAVAAGVAPERAWPMVLLVGQYGVGLGLAGIFFVALQYATGAGWSVALRRVPEAMASLLAWGGLAVLALLLVHPEVYPWAAEGALGDEPSYAFKRFWLDQPCFTVRSVLYLALWGAFTAAILRHSRRQDVDGEAAHTRRNVRLSIAFLVVFAVTVWLSSFDWLMSLDPHWYSTIFGVYNFAGLFSAGLAMIIVVSVLLRRLGPRRVGPLAGVVNDAHFHDLGKLLFAFTTFWMYVAFSQYMLIWYANIHEETAYFARRMQGLWEPLFLLNIALNWVVPFGVLLPRGTKRAPRVLVKVAIAVLAGRFLDLYLMIEPEFHPQGPVFGPVEVAAAVLVAAGSLLAVLWALGRAPLVPLHDPLFARSLRHH
ncbi:MAG: hypothetical protein AB1505_31975 [Candidatus Latescibacterota bacterium]